MITLTFYEVSSEKIQHQNPHIVVVNELSKNVLILEVGCCFDTNMDLCFSENMLKYQSLTNALAVCGHSTKLILLIFGSLGHVHRLCVRGWQIAALSKKTSKQIAKYCCVLVIIGSLHDQIQSLFICIF